MLTFPRIIVDHLCLGCWHLFTSYIFVGSSLIRSLIWMFPKNGMLSRLIVHFLLWKTIPLWAALSISYNRFASYSSAVAPQTPTSAAILIMPSKPSRISPIRAWKMSCSTFKPNGTIRQQNLQNDVRNVVSNLDGSSRWTEQYPALASSLLKNLALENTGFSSSTVGILYAQH